jgi:pilus assembly protein FimV
LWLTAFLPINSFALGLGEIEVNSFLNQPLNAEIQVISARPGEIDDLLVSLASREAFSRAGLERPLHLSDLKFTVRRNESGDSAVIVVTTRDSIKEPFLNFLIEADWSKGRLLREFTVLLDPPFYADQPAAAETLGQSSLPAATDDATASDSMSSSGADLASDEAAADGSITEPIALSGDGSRSQASTTISQTSSPPSSSEYVTDETQNIIQGDVLVVKGDTLWSIASRFKDDAHSMAQVMLAFQRTNPNAFNDGNINNMKVGAVLRAPSANELDALSKQAAYAETLVQNGLWDEYVARVTGVSPAPGAAAAGDSQSTSAGESEPQGELSLLLPGEGDSSSTGTGESTDIGQLRTKLALAEEELEASRIENKDLESRISELQARLSKVEELRKMVEIQDDSLAQLQAGLSDSQTQDIVDGESEDSMVEDATSSGAAGANTVEDTIKADEEALLEELLAEEATAQAEEQAALQKGDMPDGESESAVEDEIVKVQPMADGTEQMVDDEARPAVAVPPPAPVIITEPTSSSGGSMLDGILPQEVVDMLPSMGGIFSNPIILAALGGVIVLLLVLVVIKRRKAAEDDDFGLGSDTGNDDLFANDDEDELTPIHLAEVEDQLETDIEVPAAEDKVTAEISAGPAEEVEDEFAATAIISAADMPQSPAPATPVAEQDDVLNEVDVYLAYGLYDNAEDLLKNSLVENPDRADYRSKLLDTYFATRKVDDFVKEAENLKGMGDLGSAYWNRVQIMGYELAPDNALFSAAKDSGLSAADLEIAKPQEADFDLGAAEDEDVSFSTTDFNLGEEDGGSDFGGATNLTAGGELESTQQIPTKAGKSPALDDDSDAADDSFELPDDIGDELEFSMDDDAAGAELPAGSELADDETGEFGMLDDLDLEDFGADEVDQAADDDEVALDFGMEDEEDGDDQVGAKTEIITPNYDETAVLEMEDDDEDVTADDFTDGDEDGIDLGMEDTALKTSEDHIEDTGELVLDVQDGTEDISIIDFGGNDFEEPTDKVPSISDSELDIDDDDFVLDDEDDKDARTGTFAPGDFDEPTAVVDSLANLDDMDDLMLPDDVDEVSTKLDLARAFIDMGDTEGARGSLEEVMSEGNAEQKAEARTLLDQI